jgi:hypothetical protein
MQKNPLFHSLLNWQPEAEQIEVDVCHCPKQALMLSYTLPGCNQIFQKDDGTCWQQCGYACTACDFSQAGARPCEAAHDR